MPECGGIYGNIFRRAENYGSKYSGVYDRSDATGNKQPKTGDKQKKPRDKQTKPRNKLI